MPGPLHLARVKSETEELQCDLVAAAQLGAGDGQLRGDNIGAERVILASYYA